MKMKTINILFLSFLFIGIYSCEELETGPESTITYLPKFEVEGGDYIELTCNESASELGSVEAFEGGSPIEVSVSVSGLYFGASEISAPDEYLVNYSAVNKDSIPGAFQRTVFKKPCDGDLVNSITGIYKSTVVRNGSSGPEYTNMENVLITQVGENMYQLSDAIGGYYDVGRAYGPGYAATGMTIMANDISSDSFVYGDPVGVGAFGGVLVMKDFTVDASSGTIHFVTEWDAGYTFDVTLTKVD